MRQQSREQASRKRKRRSLCRRLRFRLVCSLLAAIACCTVGGCAGFWDDLTSRDFKFKDMFKPAPDPLWVIRNCTDGDKKSKALCSLTEPLQHGGSQQEQDVIVNLLLQSAVSDTQPLCRLAAISSLQHFKDPRAAQALMDAYERASYFQRDRPEAMETVQEQALQALGVNGNPVAVDLLVRVLKTPPLTGTAADKLNDLNQRIYAARALAHFPQYQAAEALVSVLRSEQDVALRNRATESLREITGQELPPDAQAWTEFLHKSGKEGLAKKDSSWKSVLRLTLWNPSSHE
jgi:hypothetical protein